MIDETRPRAISTLVSYSKIRVSVVEGPDAGTSRDIVSSTLRLGSSSDNDLVLADQTVSRHHCAIEPVLGGVRIRDEGSTNGVRIGSMQVFDATVAGPVQVQLGDTQLVIEPLAETVSREQAVSERFGGLIGRSQRMREVFADLARIAPTDLTLLIEAETGCGKELVADAVHHASKRAEGPYVVFDCSAVAPTLIESELFGQVRGTFTDAVDRPGLFEQAHHGTIFLDELGELPRDLQSRLLRVLEQQEVRRLGARRTTPVDVRVIAATNRNLAAEVQRGNFREDLYFRITTARVQIPPLRDRMDDLPLLVDHFLELEKSPQRVSDIPPQVWNIFKTYRWPGNVRELRNIVRRFLIMPERAFAPEQAASASPPPPADAAAPSPAALPASGPLPRLQEARREASEAFERAYIEALLARTGGDRRSAALMAGVSREMIRKLLVKYGLA